MTMTPGERGFVVYSVTVAGQGFLVRTPAIVAAILRRKL